MFQLSAETADARMTAAVGTGGIVLLPAETTAAVVVMATEMEGSRIIMRTYYAYLAAILAVIAALSGAYYFYYSGSSERKVSYAIDSFEPITIYNHVGDNGYINNSTPASFVAVLRYYGERFTGEQLAKINDDFYDISDRTRIRTTAEVQEYINDEFGYQSEKISVPDMATLKKYIYEMQIPVLSWLPMPNQPIEQIHTTIYTIVGFNERTGMLTYHDYYGGYGQEISFDDYYRLNTHISLVISPKNDEYKNNASQEKYLTPTENMRKAVPLVNQMTFAHFFINKKDRRYFDIANEVIQNPDFSLVPPYYKTLAYSYSANGYIVRERDIEKAKEMVEKAHEENLDLDKPFNDFWPGFDDWSNPIAGKLDGPYFMSGLIYESEGKYKDAIESLNEALAVWPYGQPAINVLDRVKKKMAEQ
jgi:tetratricopeptide (TPR) repeat protein